MAKLSSIFIADDNQINRLLLQSQLENYSRNITLAANGKTALAYLKQYKYDLILLDLRMPYFSGLELIKIIKQPDFINKGSPVIAITAHAQGFHRKDIIDAGFDECLIKPIFMEQLDEILHLWLPESSSNAFSKNGSDPLDYVQTLLNKTSENTSLATTIFNKLFIELPEQISTIEQAISSNDLLLAQEVTHKLHGSVSFCGFINIQELAYNLEASFLNKNNNSIKESFIPLKNKITDFIKQKKTILEQLE